MGGERRGSATDGQGMGNRKRIVAGGQERLPAEGQGMARRCQGLDQRRTRGWERFGREMARGGQTADEPKSTGGPRGDKEWQGDGKGAGNRWQGTGNGMAKASVTPK